MRVPLPYPSSIPVLRSGYLNKLVLEHLRLSLHRKRVTHTARGHTLCKKEPWRRVSPPNAYLCFTELALFLFERGNLLFDRLQGKGGRVTGRASNISIQECHFRGQRCLRHHEMKSFVSLSVQADNLLSRAELLLEHRIFLLRRGHTGLLAPRPVRHEPFRTDTSAWLELEQNRKAR